MEKATESNDVVSWKNGEFVKTAYGSVEKYTGESSFDGRPHGFGTRYQILRGGSEVTERGIFENGELVHGVIESKYREMQQVNEVIKNGSLAYKNYTIILNNEKKVERAGFKMVDNDFTFSSGFIYYKNGKKKFEGVIENSNLRIGVSYDQYGNIVHKGKFDKNWNLVLGAHYKYNKKIREGKYENGNLTTGAIYHKNESIGCQGRFEGEEESLVFGISFDKMGNKQYEGKFNNNAFVAGFAYEKGGKKQHNSESIDEYDANLIKTSIQDSKLAITEAQEIVAKIDQEMLDGWLKIATIKKKKKKKKKKNQNIDDDKSIVAESIIPQSEINDEIKSSFDFTDVANYKDFEDIAKNEEEQKSNNSVMIAAKPFIRNIGNNKERLQSNQIRSLNQSRESSVNKGIINLSTLDAKNTKTPNGSNLEKLTTQRRLSMYTQRDNKKARSASVYTKNDELVQVSKKAEELLKNHNYKRAIRSISQSVSTARNTANRPKDLSQERIFSWRVECEKKQSKEINATLK